MPTWKQGDRVRVVTRAVSEEDRKKGRYFDHMAGLVGSVQAVYADTQVAVQVDPDSLTAVTADVQKASTLRMREKFANSVSEEQRKALSKEELEFNAHYVLLVQSNDLEKV